MITIMLGIIGVCYIIETILDRPDWGQVIYHSVVPSLDGPESILLATGILGATVMPHVIFLHASLTQGRIVVTDPVQHRRLFRFEIADVTIAMGVAGFVNAAMLIMAAATFHRAGLVDIASIEEAYKTLEPLLGSAARWIFALSLLATGLSSTTVGTMAGQVVMQGFLQRHIPIWLRRLVTILPDLILMGTHGRGPLMAYDLARAVGAQLDLLAVVPTLARLTSTSAVASRFAPGSSKAMLWTQSIGAKVLAKTQRPVLLMPV